jgi:isoamylase
VLIVMNSFEGPVDFTFPKIENGEACSLLADTNMEDCKSGEDFAIGSKYQVTDRSLLLFAVNSA